MEEKKKNSKRKLINITMLLGPGEPYPYFPPPPRPTTQTDITTTKLKLNLLKFCPLQTLNILIPRPSSLIPLCLGLLISKLGIIAHPLQVVVEYKLNNLH